MKKPLLALAALALCLSGCGSSSSQKAAKSESPEATTSAAAPEVPESSAPTSASALSENEQLVQTFADALDALSIEHSEPQRTEAGLMSKASYDLKVNGYDAGINIFVDEQSQAAWVKASDSLGGVCVVIDGAALSLNSSEGVANSAEIAPRIAQEVGGKAHGD